VWRVRPAIILSGIAHLNLLVLWLRPIFPQRTHILVRQNGSSSAMLAALGCPSLSRFLYRSAYRWADGVICQTRSMVDELREDLCIELPNAFVLPNPVDTASIRAAAAHTKSMWRSRGPNLLAVGRLVPEKGFDLLMTAFASVHHQFPGAELVIAGCGHCEHALRTQCRNLALEDHVQFVGHAPSPAAYFSGASLFVLSSRDEGLPNALLEAVAAGLPIAALPASRGLAELLRAKSGVWLGAEVSAKELEQILCQALASICPGQRFSHCWIEPFDERTAIRAYEDAIDRALQERFR
jgi:glycosyltransferase involved in cell wall biosynthesis